MQYITSSYTVGWVAMLVCSLFNHKKKHSSTMYNVQQIKYTKGTMFNKYSVQSIHYKRGAVSYLCTFCTEQKLNHTTQLSFQRWPQRALVEHKYPQGPCNWKGERYSEKFPPIADKTASIKIWQDWNETQRGCRRSNYKFWIDWISNSFDQ